MNSCAAKPHRGVPSSRRIIKVTLHSGAINLKNRRRKPKNERRAYDKQLEKFRRIQQKVEHQQNAISRQDPHGAALLKKTMHRVKAYEARFEKEFESMTEMPEYEEAMFTKFGSRACIPNGKVVLDFSLDALRVPVSADPEKMRSSRAVSAFYTRTRTHLHYW